MSLTTMSAWYMDTWVNAAMVRNVPYCPQTVDALHPEMIVHAERGRPVETDRRHVQCGQIHPSSGGHQQLPADDRLTPRDSQTRSARRRDALIRPSLPS